MDHWNAIETHPATPLKALFDTNSDRVEQLSFEHAGIYFDFSKTHMDSDLLEKFAHLAQAKDLAGQIEKLTHGDIINPSEGRAAEHTAERGIGAEMSVHHARLLRNRMQGLILAIDEGLLGEIEYIIHLGIGGSALGPELLLEALKLGDEKYETAVISNIDGCALEPVLERFDAHKTLIVLASKSFTTAETFLNAASVLNWMREQGVSDPFGKVVALTANPEKAVIWGVDESRILPFADTIGGRYSLWSSIGFSAALTLGMDVFDDLLAGAAEMDRHFQSAPLLENIPAIAAFCDQYYCQARGCETRAVFAYDERLRLLPVYLQQLEMESNGKSVTSDGKPLDRHSSPIIWGGVGTDAQHAVFQLLHQGTHLVPVEFLAVIEPGHSLAEEHHRSLLLNCFAQASALMTGQASDDGNRNYPGDKPSVTILLDDLDGRKLGALIAFYEHRTFVNAMLLGINPFDQFGVELGKETANALLAGEGNKMDPSTEILKNRAFPA
ncbi:glucose-6-phosphate isomerase [Parasphingorhabdus sp.]|uniref:glucose-6-phosphate isomerase n=1 Tax=Parasphingorhabdus sp. TaxID=2709688 RepID=UPI002F91C6CA